MRMDRRRRKNRTARHTCTLTALRGSAAILFASAPVKFGGGCIRAYVKTPGNAPTASVLAFNRQLLTTFAVASSGGNLRVNVSCDRTRNSTLKGSRSGRRSVIVAIEPATVSSGAKPDEWLSDFEVIFSSMKVVDLHRRLVGLDAPADCGLIGLALRGLLTDVRRARGIATTPSRSPTIRSSALIVTLPISTGSLIQPIAP
jgi:hypothetical protein